MSGRRVAAYAERGLLRAKDGNENGPLVTGVLPKSNGLAEVELSVRCSTKPSQFAQSNARPAEAGTPYALFDHFGNAPSSRGLQDDLRFEDVKLGLQKFRKGPKVLKIMDH